jgi:hypothetical protein
MTTTAYPGRGSTLANGGTAGSSYTTLAQLKKFAFSGLKAESDDITNLSSPTINKEWLKTIVDSDNVTFTGVLNPADPTYESLLANLYTAGQAATNYWQITLTDGSVLTFQGFVLDFKPADVEYNKALSFTGTLKITGQVTAVWT